MSTRVDTDALIDRLAAKMGPTHPDLMKEAWAELYRLDPGLRGRAEHAEKMSAERRSAEAVARYEAWRAKWAPKMSQAQADARRKRIWEMRKSGAKYREIGVELELSVQRARQLFETADRRMRHAYLVHYRRSKDDFARGVEHTFCAGDRWEEDRERPFYEVEAVRYLHECAGLFAKLGGTELAA